MIEYDKGIKDDPFLGNHTLFQSIKDLNWDNFNKTFDFISEYKQSYGYDLDKLSNTDNILYSKHPHSGRDFKKIRLIG